MTCIPRSHFSTLYPESLHRWTDDGFFSSDLKSVIEESGQFVCGHFAESGFRILFLWNSFLSFHRIHIKLLVWQYLRRKQMQNYSWPDAGYSALTSLVRDAICRLGDIASSANWLPSQFSSLSGAWYTVSPYLITRHHTFRHIQTRKKHLHFYASAWIIKVFPDRFRGPTWDWTADLMIMNHAL